MGLMSKRFASVRKMGAPNLSADEQHWPLNRVIDEAVGYERILNMF